MNSAIPAKPTDEDEQFARQREPVPPPEKGNHVNPKPGTVPPVSPEPPARQEGVVSNPDFI